MTSGSYISGLKCVSPLSNPRHERFAQALFEGKSAHQAYIDAGYKECRQNAARLTTKDDIKARLSGLQTAVAKKSEVTVQSLLDELEDARQRANNLDQLSASVRAIEAKAKVSGLLTQKIEVTNINDSFDNAESLEDVAAAIAAGKGYTLKPEDRANFAELIGDWDNAMNEFLAAHAAKAIEPIKSDPEIIARHERKRLGLPTPVRPNGGGSPR